MKHIDQQKNEKDGWCRNKLKQPNENIIKVLENTFYQSESAKSIE